MFIDGEGRRAEVIMMIRDGHGPLPWIRVSSRRNILLGEGYYRDVSEALKHLDAETLIEVLTLPTRDASL